MKDIEGSVTLPVNTLLLMTEGIEGRRMIWHEYPLLLMMQDTGGSCVVLSVNTRPPL